MRKVKKDHFWLIVGWVLVISAIVFTVTSNKFLPGFFRNHASPAPEPIQNQIVEASPSPTPSSPKILPLRLFFVAIGDNGKNGEMIGCGDSLAPVEIQLPETETPLQAVLQQLLSTKTQTVGPSKLYNSLYQSNLQFKDAAIKDGVATVHLTGTYQFGGECDNPRFQAQLEKTVKQFSNVSEAQIFINDKSLSDVISLK